MAVKQTLEQELQKIRERELEREAERKSKTFGIPYLNLLGIPIQQEALLLATEDDSRKGEFIVFQKMGREIRIATINPDGPVLKETMGGLAKQGFEVSLYFVSRQSIERGWGQYKKILPPPPVITGAVEISSDRIRKFLQKIRTLDDTKELLKTVDLARVTEGLEIIFSSAVQLDASDIHFEPRETEALLRFRLDGILHDVVFFPRPIFEKIVSRIKILAGLKLNVTTSAQDGRLSIEIDATPVEIRVSTIPTNEGESIVMRVLNPKKLIEFDELGLRGAFREVLERELAKTTGMILVTGPTGSGKTTTLYAFLKKLASPDAKIITIEDPIEYRLGGISQTQVDPKKNYTFATGLRAILRQDPDVVLVGEIRDKETAETALHAALTGHLVFSTLHTNDAPGTIARLVDMEINPNIIAPAINIALAQRLVRTICKKCGELVPPKPEVKRVLEKFLKTLPATTPRLSMQDIKIPATRGCKRCTDGYKGRIGLFEFFRIDKEMEKQIIRGAPTSELRELAIQKGMVTIQQDGVLRVLEGITTLEEIERVTGKLETG